MNTDTIIMTAMGGCCCSLLAGGVFLIIIGTVMKTRFGVNLGGARCSECDTPAPGARSPQDVYEMLWGGWTCHECGQKNDKWGRPR